MTESNSTVYINPLANRSLAEFHDILKDLLLENNCEITFTKKDGTERVMPCTLQAEVLPEILTESTRTKEKNMETINVWCLDKQAWRSFRVENVKSIRMLT